MKTLDEFLDEVAENCCSPYSLKSAKIIRLMKEVIDQIDIPMSMRMSDSANKHFLYKEIDKILNE